MTKQNISRILLAVLILVNVYAIYRINSNATISSSYDAGYSRRTGVGQLDSFWSKYTGNAKRFEITYEDKLKAEDDSTNVMIVLGVIDVVLVGALYLLNKKPAAPKPRPLTVEERRELRFERKRRNR